MAAEYGLHYRAGRIGDAFRYHGSLIVGEDESDDTTSTWTAQMSIALRTAQADDSSVHPSYTFSEANHERAMSRAYEWLVTVMANVLRAETHEVNVGVTDWSSWDDTPYY